MKICPVILAGGSGTRFWPLSRKESPKQVLNLSGQNTLISEAVSRFFTVTEQENTYILTTAQQHIQIEKALPKDSKVNYINEPMPRGTAACILLAALKLNKLYGDCIMCISPSDHYITKQEEFNKTILNAIDCAENKECIVTIGIKPTFPSTGYGYICCDYSLKQGSAFFVSEFVEKPNINKAKDYISQGNYFWNSGIFIFRTSVIIENFKRFLPKVYDKLYSCIDFLNTENESLYLSDLYHSIQNISIDYAIIERSNNVYVVPADMGWNDIGSWDSLGCIFPTDENGNIVRSSTINIDTKNCVIYSENALVATIGVEDMIIVNCNDALLVCPKKEVQRVREVVEQIDKEKLYQYL